MVLTSELLLARLLVGEGAAFLLSAFWVKILVHCIEHKLLDILTVHLHFLTCEYLDLV